MSISKGFRSANRSPTQGPMAWALSSGIAPALGGNTAGVDDDARALQRIGTKTRFVRNKVIFSEGEPANYAYKVISGVVRLCKHLSDGRRQIAHFAFPGDFVSVGEHEEHGFSAEAVTDVVLMCFSQHSLSALSDLRPSLRRRFSQQVSQRLRELQDHLAVLGRQTAKERVASFLLYLSSRVGEDDDLVDAPMSRHDMADYLGLTDETISRTLAELKRECSIETPNVHQFLMLNVNALQSLADGEAQLAAA